MASGRIHGNPEATLAVSRHVGHVNRETFKSPRRAFLGNLTPNNQVFPDWPQFDDAFRAENLVALVEAALLNTSMRPHSLCLAIKPSS